MRIHIRDGMQKISQPNPIEACEFYLTIQKKNYTLVVK